MEKRFCDICDAPAPNRASERKKKIVLQKNLLCDDSAEITGTFYLNFEKHSTGYGGPPDLCDKCFKNLLTKYKKQST